MIGKIELIENALRKDRLHHLFCGVDEKVVSFQASIPTDVEVIFEAWTEFVEGKPLELSALWDLFMDTLVRISKDENYNWFSLYYLMFFLMYFKQSGRYPDRTQAMISRVVSNISHYEINLKQDYRWTGDKAYGFSLWNDVVRMTNNMTEEFPFDFSLTQKIS